MKYYLLDFSMCEAKYCFVRGNFSFDTTLMRGGKEILPEMKADGIEVLDYHIDEAEGGLVSGDYFTTTENHLTVSSRFADMVRTQYNTGRCEYLPAQVLDSKGNVIVPDMVVINPIDPIECLDRQNSEMDNDSDDPMVQVFGKFFLLKNHIPEDLDVFRVPGLLYYIFSERLVRSINERGYTNFHFKEVLLH